MPSTYTLTDTRGARRTYGGTCRITRVKSYRHPHDGRWWILLTAVDGERVKLLTAYGQKNIEAKRAVFRLSDVSEDEATELVAICGARRAARGYGERLSAEPERPPSTMGELLDILPEEFGAFGGDLDGGELPPIAEIFDRLGFSIVESLDDLVGGEVLRIEEEEVVEPPAPARGRSKSSRPSFDGWAEALGL